MNMSISCSAEVSAVLARRGERVAPPQRAPELLERPPRGLPAHQLGELELPQQAADDLHVLRQPPARVAVPPRRQRGLHDDGPWTPAASASGASTPTSWTMLEACPSMVQKPLELSKEPATVPGHCTTASCSMDFVVAIGDFD